MVQAAGLIRDISSRDIFFLKPAGFTPSSDIARPEREGPTQKDIPVDNDGGMLPGEALIVSDLSKVVIGSGDAVPLSSFRTDRGLKEYVLGPKYERLPFSVRYYDSGRWSKSIDTLKEKFRALAEMAKADDALARDISPDRMSIAGWEMSSLNMLFREAVDVQKHLCRFMQEYPERLYMDPLAAVYHNMTNLLSFLRTTPPPIRFNYTATKDERADSILIVTSSEQGARLLLGWKSKMADVNGVKMRSDIMNGLRPARDFINEISAVRGYAHYIPSMFPFGMTGDVQAYVIEPPVHSFAVDDWSRTRAQRLWKHFHDGRGEAEIERLFTEGFVSLKRMMGLNPGNSDRKRYVFEMCHPFISGKEPCHSFESGHFSASVMPVKLKESGEFSFLAHTMPTAWIVGHGALSVRSPRGYEVDLSAGDACLFPASASGTYELSVLQEPTCLIAVSGKLAPVGTLGLKFMMGYAAG